MGHPNSSALRIQAGIPDTGLLYFKDTLREPNASIKELLMGFQPGAIVGLGLSENDRRRVLGQTPDLNILTWLITQAARIIQ